MSTYVTQQRKALIDFLSNHPDEMLSAKEIASGVTGENISVSSVYRNLAALESKGQVRRQYDGDIREVRYQYLGAMCRGNLHLCCKRCGRTFHMSTGGARTLLDDVANSEGFSVDMGETVLFGTCGSCKETY